MLKVIVSGIKFILRFYINGNGNIQWLNFDSKFASLTLSVHPIPLIMGDGCPNMYTEHTFLGKIGPKEVNIGPELGTHLSG